MSQTNADPPSPLEIRLAKDRRTLTVVFDDGASFDLSAELLRVTSPSAEVQGHSESERKTIGGKRNVEILLAIMRYASVSMTCTRPAYFPGHSCMGSGAMPGGYSSRIWMILPPRVSIVTSRAPVSSLDAFLLPPWHIGCLAPYADKQERKAMGPECRSRRSSRTGDTHAGHRISVEHTGACTES